MMVRRERVQRCTVLIVHEGYAEGCVLRHIKHLYVGRDSSVALTLRNARGKGGRQVLEFATRIKRRKEYDEVVVLVDTDTDWGNDDRRRAERSRIGVLESEPCLEAWLLSINGRVPRGTSARIKDQFKSAFGGAAHDEGIYARHFPKASLDRARPNVPVLDRLLKILGA